MFVRDSNRNAALNYRRVFAGSAISEGHVMTNPENRLVVLIWTVFIGGVLVGYALATLARGVLG